MPQPPSIYDHPEAKAFIRAICAEPADDNVRLIFCDWLDDHVADCPACKGSGSVEFVGRPQASFLSGDVWPEIPRRPGMCPVCHGTGTNGAAERAEYIRLAIEYASLVASMPEPPNARAYEINKRLGILKRTYHYQWFATPFTDHVTIGYDRGFISHVRCTLAQFDAHAGEIARHHPVTRWEITDREPYRPNGDSVLMHRDDAVNGYWWLPPTLRPLPSDIPRYILELMTDDWDGVSRSAKGYHTREEALAALCAACVKVANERAETLDQIRDTPIRGLEITAVFIDEFTSPPGPL